MASNGFTPFTPRAQNIPLAIGFMVLATVFIAASTLFAKALGTGVFGPPMHALQISNGRFLFAFMAISGAVLITRQPIRNPDLRLHAVRTVFGWGGVTLMFAAVAFIPMSDATAISFLNPVFAMILAIPLLGEKVGPWRWAAAGIALTGAVILLRPTTGSLQFGAILALMAAVVMGFEVIFIKKLAGREGPLQILWVNNSFGLGISAVAVLAVWEMPTLAQWGGLAGVGLSMAVAQACFVNAVARAEASFIVPFTYATLVFASLYDGIIFGVVPDVVSSVGAGIIVAGGVLLAWREARLARRK